MRFATRGLIAAWVVASAWATDTSSPAAKPKAAEMFEQKYMLAATKELTKSTSKKSEAHDDDDEVDGDTGAEVDVDTDAEAAAESEEAYDETSAVADGDTEVDADGDTEVDADGDAEVEANGDAEAEDDKKAPTEDGTIADGDEMAPTSGKSGDTGFKGPPEAKSDEAEAGGTCLEDWPELRAAAAEDVSDGAEDVMFALAPWCKVYEKCPNYAKALLDTAVKCLKDAVVTDGDDELSVDSQGVFVPLEAILCSSTCEPAVDALLDVTTSKKSWLEKADEDENVDLDQRDAFDKIMGDDPSLGLSERTMERVSIKARNHLLNCLEEANVDETELSLPMTIEGLTGLSDLYSSVTTVPVECRASRLDWFKDRLAYYTGVEYAEERLCDGSRIGVLVALTILGVNAALLLAAWLAAIHFVTNRRPCFMCMQKMAPRMLRCIERCGLGPTPEQKESWGDIVAAPDEDGTPADEEAPGRMKL